MPQVAQTMRPAMIAAIAGTSVSAVPHAHAAITPNKSGPVPDPKLHSAGKRSDRGAGEIGHKDCPEPARGEAKRRCSEMKADIGEDCDEVEQYAKPNGVGRNQLRIFEMPQHCPS